MNIDLNKIVRQNILNLSPYSSARDEFSGAEGVFLDANENPNGNYNRYPDPHQVELKAELAKVKSVSPDNMFLGNGSDEVIDLIYRLFASPGKDKVIICPPTYGMYEVAANINDIEIVNIPLLPNFQLNIPAIAEAIEKDASIKLIFLCSPNNPTGNLISGVEEIVQKFNGIVVVDEAYIDFSPESSKVPSILRYNNLIVLQTLSKAWGLAGIRVGFAFAQSGIIALLNKIKSPYNISMLNQQHALSKLQKHEEFDRERAEILSERNRLEKELQSLSMVKKIYPSDANFLLIEVANALKVYNELANKNVIVRNRDSLIKNCIRITIGTKQENDILLTELKNISQ